MPGSATRAINPTEDAHAHRAMDESASRWPAAEVEKAQPWGDIEWLLLQIVVHEEDWRGVQNPPGVPAIPQALPSQVQCDHLDSGIAVHLLPASVGTSGNGCVAS